MKRVHYIDNYLINPQHPVTVNLIGASLERYIDVDVQFHVFFTQRSEAES